MYINVVRHYHSFFFFFFFFYFFYVSYCVRLSGRYILIGRWIHFLCESSIFKQAKHTKSYTVYMHMITQTLPLARICGSMHSCIHASMHPFRHAGIHVFVFMYVHALCRWDPPGMSCILLITQVRCSHALSVSAVYIHTYIHTYMHTYIHTYIHTYKPSPHWLQVFASCKAISQINLHLSAISQRRRHVDLIYIWPFVLPEHTQRV
jgi:hypothetical protein